MTSSTVEKAEVKDNICHVTIKTPKGTEEVKADIVLSAVGITPNLENIGIEETGIALENGKVKWTNTTVPMCQAFTHWRHSARAGIGTRGFRGRNLLCGKHRRQTSGTCGYKNVPACTYTVPEIASVGLTEKAAREAGYSVKVGKFLIRLR